MNSPYTIYNTYYKLAYVLLYTFRLLSQVSSSDATLMFPLLLRFDLVSFRFWVPFFAFSIAFFYSPKSTLHAQ